MANTKISALSALTGAALAVGDLHPIVDVSDTTQGAGGSTKYISTAELILGILGNSAVLTQSLTGSSATSLVNATATWNTSGNPSLIKAVVTVTAVGSASTAALLDLTTAAARGIKVFADGNARIQLDASNYILFDNSTNSGIDVVIGGAVRHRTGYYGTRYIDGVGPYFSNSGTNVTTVDAGIIRLAAALLKITAGTGGSSNGSLYLGEITSIPTAVANGAILFTEDNGSGKTRLMARFGSGADQQIAIEP